MPPLRIAYFGTYEMQEGYPRNRFLIDALETAGVEVVRCHRPIWERGQRASRPWSIFTAAPRWLCAQRQLARELQTGGHFDALVLGYPGHLDLPLARRLARRREIPLIFDAFLPVAQTLCEDRGRWTALRGFAHWIEKRLLRWPDRILVDTRAHAGYFAQAFGLPESKLAALPVGSAMPLGTTEAERPPGSRAGSLSVLFVGTYVPLQGIETIVDAAAALRDRQITFTLVGSGQDYAAARRRAQRLCAPIKFIDEWIPEVRLDRWIRGADVCLGIFGDTAKAQRVVPCKIYDAITRGRPVITADSPAIRELLVPGETVGLVPPSDPDALAQLLRRWTERPEVRARIGDAARKVAEERLTPAVVGERFRELLREAAASRRAAPE